MSNTFEMDAAELTLGLCMTDETFFDNVKDIIDEINLFNEFHHYIVIWEIIKDYAADYGGIPTKPFILVDVEDTDKQAVEAILTRLQGLEFNSTSKKIIEEYLKDSLEEYAKTSLSSTDNIRAEMARLDKMFNISTGVQASPVTDILLPLEEQVSLLKEAEKIPTYLDFLDLLLRGGTMRGDLCGFILPSGAGKTTIAWQAAYESAMRKKHVILVTFEQKYDTDLRTRITTLAAGTNKDTIKNMIKTKSISVLDDINRTQYKNSMELINKYLHVVDTFAQDNVGISSFKDLFETIVKNVNLEKPGPDEEFDSERHPSLVVLDWWGPLRTKLLAAMPSYYGSDSQARRMYIQETLRNAKVVTQEFKTRTFIFHQSSGEQASKESGRRVVSQSAQEDKNFNNMFDYCFVTDQPNPTNYSMNLVMDKARGEKRAQTKIYLDGNHCKLRSATTAHGGHFLPTENHNKDNASKGPSAFKSEFFLDS